MKATIDILKEARSVKAVLCSLSTEKKNEALLKQLKDNGVTVNELSNLDEFKNLSKAVYDQYSSNPTIKAFIEENQ